MKYNWFEMDGFVRSMMARAVLNKWVIIPVAVLAGTGGYYLFNSSDGQRHSFFERQISERIVDKAVRDLPGSYAGKNIALIQLADDNTGFVTQQIRARIQDTGKYHLVPDGRIGKALAQLLDHPAQTTFDAVVTGKLLRADGIIFGSLPNYSVDEDSARAQLVLRMADCQTGDAVFSRTYQEQLGGGPLSGDYWRAHLADSPVGTRMLVWIAIALLLPLIAAPLISRATALESNGVNLAVLALITGIDLLAAFLLTGFWVTSVWTALLLILATAGSGFYNYRMATIIDDMNR